LVAVIGENVEALPEQEAMHLDLDAAGPLAELRGDEDLDVVELERLVAAEVLALEVGVDRHLDVAASAEWWDEVQRGATASRSHQLDGFR
jgi:hypothetical protein